MLIENEKIPDATVALVLNGDAKEASMQDICQGKTVLLVGFPGVHTPICTLQHIPSLVKNLEAFKKRGVEDVYCISDDNSWALHEWSKNIDGANALNFISDGNREFLLKSNLARGDKEVFLGGKYGRFYAFIRDGVVISFRAEETVFSTDLTNGFKIEDDIAKCV